jgi:exodeoxyribonuclease VII small subunit
VADERPEPRFEEALARLEELVRALEGGELSLEDSLARFEEGVALFRLCARRLEGAKVRLRQLEESPDGPRERDLSEDEE